MISLTRIHKSYKNGSILTPVLHDISLEVASGEFLFLVGPSGSGKSTLLSIMGCVLAPDSGTLQMLGKPITGLSKSALTRFRREHMGFVFQRFHLFKGLTATENVRVPLDLMGIGRMQADRAARELLEAVGLADKLDSDINRLSGGQRQRVAVARALVTKPDVVFADEPTASLDAESGRKTVELMRNLAKDRKTTVVVVTHDSRILSYADRVVLLEDGRIAAEPTVDSLTRH